MYMYIYIYLYMYIYMYMYMYMYIYNLNGLSSFLHWCHFEDFRCPMFEANHIIYGSRWQQIKNPAMKNLSRIGQSMDWFCWEHFHRKPMGFYPVKYGGFPVKMFPTKPIHWAKHQNHPKKGAKNPKTFLAEATKTSKADADKATPLLRRFEERMAHWFCPKIER